MGTSSPFPAGTRPRERRRRPRVCSGRDPSQRRHPNDRAELNAGRDLALSSLTFARHPAPRELLERTGSGDSPAGADEWTSKTSSAVTAMACTSSSARVGKAEVRFEHGGWLCVDDARRVRDVLVRTWHRRCAPMRHCVPEAVPEYGSHGRAGPRGPLHRLAQEPGVGLPHTGLAVGPALSAGLRSKTM